MNKHIGKTQFPGKALPLFKPPKKIILPDARKLGLVRYFTGKPCKRGHICERQTSSATCMQCDREKYAVRKPIRLYQMRKWQAANREKMRELSRCWKQRNPDAGLVYDANRRARMMGLDGTVTREGIKQLLKQQKNKCINCGRALLKYHRDHIKPLAKGGIHSLKNIQLLCPSCNFRKHTKDPIDWAQENGRLL